MHLGLITSIPLLLGTTDRGNQIILHITRTSYRVIPFYLRTQEFGILTALCGETPAAKMLPLHTGIWNGHVGRQKQLNGGSFSPCFMSGKLPGLCIVPVAADNDIHHVQACSSVYTCHCLSLSCVITEASMHSYCSLVKLWHSSVLGKGESVTWLHPLIVS